MVKPVHSKRKLFSSSREHKENTPQDLDSSNQLGIECANQDENLVEKKKNLKLSNLKATQVSPTQSGPSTPHQRPLPCFSSPSNLKNVSSVSGTLSNVHGRPHSMPMSERQQIALLMQMSSPSPNKCTNSNSTTPSLSSPRSNSPHTPRLAATATSTTTSSSSEGPGTPTMATTRCGGVAKRNERGETPLHVAAIRGDSERVHQLIQRGSEVNAVDYAGWTALHEACNRGFISVAQELISAGASVNAKGLDNDTPLHDACVNNHFKLVELLLESGASTSVVNRYGQTPSDVCRSPVILSLLQQASGNNSENSSSPKTSDVSSKMSRRTPPNSTKPEKMEAKETNKEKEEESSGCDVGNPDQETPTTLSSSSPTTSSTNTTVVSSGNSGSSPSSPRVTLRLPQSSSRSPDKNSRVTSDTKSSVDSSADDPYEFKCSKDESSNGGSSGSLARETEASNSSSSTSANASNITSNIKSEVNDDKEGVKRILEEEDEEADQMKRKRKREDNKESSQGKNVNRGNRLSGDKSSKPTQRAGAMNPTPTASSQSYTSKSSSSSTATTSSFSMAGSAATVTSTANTSPSTSTTASSSDSSRKSPPMGSSSSPKAAPSNVDKEDASDEEGGRCGSNSSGGSAGGPKVPPLKIVLSSCGTGGTGPSNTTSQEPEVTTAATKGNSSKHLPYVVPASQADCEENSSPANTSPAESKEKDAANLSLNIKEEPLSPGGSNCSERSAAAASRVTRSQRGSGTGGSSSAEENSTNVKSEIKVEVKPEESSQPSTSTPCSSNSVPTTSSESVHPRKRKLNIKEEETPETSQPPLPEQPLSNCYQMFQKIRKQIDDRRKLLFPVQPKPPQGFKDYLMNRGTYVLANNPASQHSVLKMSPPQSLSQPLKDLFGEQENDRYKLRLQHQVERERLVLSVEQEILRVHGRAARALANQVLPFSACTMLRDQEVYNILTPEQEEKHRNARSRYNGRLFISWLQDVDDKWEKIKESMVHRQQHEAESLNAVHRMDWEWKLKELGLCDNKSRPVIEEHHVPMVAVSDFDLLPA